MRMDSPKRILLLAVTAIFTVVFLRLLWTLVGSSEALVPAPVPDEVEPLPGKMSDTCQERGNGGWRTMELPPDHKLYLYSAFYDPVIPPRPTVRVLALGPLALEKRPPPLVCVMEQDSSSLPGRPRPSNSSSQRRRTASSVPARIQIIPEHHGTRYTALHILCDLPHHYLRPASVSFALTTQGPELASLEVIYPASRLQRNLTLCYPVFFDFFNSARLVEGVELARLLGAQRVVVYCHSVTAHVRQVIDHYVREGFLEVLPWNIPSVHVHYYGQMSAINECLYRNLLTSRYVMIYDIDEVIVPTEGRNWTQLIEDLGFDESKAGAMMFRMSFYHGEGGGDDMSLEQRSVASWLGLTSLLTPNREEKIYPWGVRTKTLVKPGAVETMGIHWPHSMRPGVAEAMNVSETDGLVMHFRNGGAPAPLRDPHLGHLAPRLLANVQRVRDAIARHQQQQQEQQQQEQ